MLIGLCGLYSDHMLNDVQSTSLVKYISFQCELKEKYEIMVLAAPLHADLDKLRNELHS